MDSDKPPRCGWILFQFGAQRRDVCVDSSRGGITFVTPDSIQQVVAGHDLAGLSSKQPQDTEFFSRHLDRCAMFQRFKAAEIHDDVVESKLVGLRFGALSTP